MEEVCPEIKQFFKKMSVSLMIVAHCRKIKLDSLKYENAFSDNAHSPTASSNLFYQTSLH